MERAFYRSLAGVCVTGLAVAAAQPPAAPPYELPPTNPPPQQPSEPMLPATVEVDRAPAHSAPAAGGKPKPKVTTKPYVRPANEDERTKAARLQAFLARAGFSPGLIDGKPGAKTKLALEEYTVAKGVDPTAAPEGSTVDAAPVNTAAWTRTYKISEADGALITGAIPTDWNERAALSVSGYESLQELLAERGWCSQETVAWLNQSLTMSELKVGDEVTLPDVPDPLTPGVKAVGLPKMARVEVSLGAKAVRGYADAEGTQQVSLMHCSIARLVEKRPSGELHVKVIATEPAYTFDPKDWPEVEGITTKLTIAPGPRNPVGAAWVGLDLPGYGMHGTVRPQDIGKTGSHGCFRLFNWEAVRLARAVKVGTVVVVKE
ncbi:MAG: L,D-transpeptidase [Phycisphaerales bacterium]